MEVSKLAAALAALACLSACSSEQVDVSGALYVVDGQETDTWTASPVPTRLDVDLVGKKRTLLTSVDAPSPVIELGAGAPPESLGAFEVTGYDARDEAVVHGRSVTYSISTFAYASPAVFVARTGGVSRAPRQLLFEYQHPLVEVVGHAYVLIAGGDLSSATQNPIDLYDAANWFVAAKQTWLTAVPKSWALSGSTLLVINDDGASSIDLLTSTVTTPIPPKKFDFASVVGGQTLIATDDTRYIVGATRATGDATDRVLRVAPDGTLTALTLTAPRLGAAAGLIADQLVVAGGSDTAVGAEILNAAGTAFVELALEADAVQGAALTQIDSTTALLVGGTDAEGKSAGLRTFDVSCTKSCSSTPLAELAFDYSRAQALTLADEKLFVSGESEDGQTHVFTLEKAADAFALEEIELRTPRAGASLVAFPNGQAALVGGKATADGSPASSVELYFPTL